MPLKCLRYIPIIFCVALIYGYPFFCEFCVFCVILATLTFYLIKCIMCNVFNIRQICENVLIVKFSSEHISHITRYRFNLHRFTFKETVKIVGYLFLMDSATPILYQFLMNLARSHTCLS